MFIGSLIDAYACESKILLVVPYCQPQLASYYSRKNEWLELLLSKLTEFRLSMLSLGRIGMIGKVEK